MGYVWTENERLLYEQAVAISSGDRMHEIPDRELITFQKCRFSGLSMGGRMIIETPDKLIFLDMDAASLDRLHHVIELTFSHQDRSIPSRWPEEWYWRRTPTGDQKTP